MLDFFVFYLVEDCLLLLLLQLEACLLDFVLKLSAGAEYVTAWIVADEHADESQRFFAHHYAFVEKLAIGAIECLCEYVELHFAFGG